tara:strand:+ start:678 stop:785 length:108 start_codon:yes stop_codon:yes gene_type:complete
MNAIHNASLDFHRAAKKPSPEMADVNNGKSIKTSY